VIERIVGIDFSGAAAAGTAIWVAEAHFEDGRVRIERCRPAAELPASHRDRDRCLPALVAFIGQMRRAIVGCDFPFSLPAAMIEAPTWRAFALAFGDCFPSAREFMEDCRRRGGGREIRRACDRESRVPFAAYNLRIYRQTYHGIRDFLAPLLRDGAAVVLPMERSDGDRPWIIETCPASTLKHAGLYPSYKGPSGSARDARRHIVRGLVRSGLVAPLSPSLRRLAIDNTGGDALDSMIAAAATGRAFLTGALAPRLSDPHDHLEGRVYY
jgi:hypothetical protein